LVIIPVYNERDKIEQIRSSSTVRKVPQIEMGFGAWRKDFRIKEVPIVFEGGRVGESKMSKKIVREAI
jgi:hypothetical protein